MTDIFPGATLRQLVEWGFPQGSLRAAPPPDLGFGVVHITGNSRLPSAENEINWRLNDPANQNSATFFVNRDGTIWQALGDPLHMAPWSNGDASLPDMSNPRIAACINAGVNPNVRTVVSIENVGYEPGSPITAEQEQANAAIFRYYFGKARVPISRETIIGHYQINGKDRPNCPGVDKSVIDRIVAIAAPEEDDMDARPETFRRKSGVAALPAGTEFNAFRYLGRNADGSPRLERHNGLKWTSATSAHVIGLAHWDEGVAEANCYPVSPYVYVPGKGPLPLLWWSKDPLPAPTIQWDATALRREGAARVLDAAKVAAKTLGAT